MTSSDFLKGVTFFEVRKASGDICFSKKLFSTLKNVIFEKIMFDCDMYHFINSNMTLTPGWLSIMPSFLLIPLRDNVTYMLHDC